MPRNRQVVLINPGQDGAANAPLGTSREVLRTLAKYNTAPDGSPDSLGVVYGPGIEVQMPFVGEKDDVLQALISLTDEDIAWSVLGRICADNGWKLMDPESGRTFGG